MRNFKIAESEDHDDWGLEYLHDPCGSNFLISNKERVDKFMQRFSKMVEIYLSFCQFSDPNEEEDSSKQPEKKVDRRRREYKL